MPLIQGYSNATRSRNIATLRRDGYSPEQASAIAYQIQRKARRRDLARRNPGSAIPQALFYVAAGAAVGGGIGAVNGALAQPQDILGGAVGGASVGVAGVAAGGFVFGLMSPADRNVGFAAAGIGLGTLILANLATSIASATTATSA